MIKNRGTELYTSISGIIGGALTLGLALLIGFGVKFIKGKRKKVNVH